MRIALRQPEPCLILRPGRVAGRSLSPPGPQGSARFRMLRRQGRGGSRSSGGVSRAANMTKLR
jgi:hypothetical protein